MGTNPTKAADNIYCRCRKEAAKYNEKLKSREGAAELLGLSVSSLSDYELGNTKVVPVDKVVLMADLYNAPELKPYYCRECCPLGAGNPVIPLEDFDRATLQVISSFRKMNKTPDALLDIFEDGVVSEEEKPDLYEQLKIMDEIENRIKAFRLALKKNGVLE